MSQLKRNLIVDIVILLAFLVSSDPNLTGITVHEWLSLGLFVTLIVHILLHWNWIVRVAGTYFKRLLQTSRLKFAVDVLLFAAFIAVTFSGLLISRSILPMLRIELPEDFSWRSIHSLSADAVVLMVGVHLALNWRWWAALAKNYILIPLQTRLARPPKSNPAPAPVTVRSDDRIW